jgi:polar amino acid transport system permease protein
MNYVFQFGTVLDHAPLLLYGAWSTIWMTAFGTVGGLFIAIICVFLGATGSKSVRLLVESYVEIIRNTPFLVQLFVLYFSLPALGIRLNADQAAVIGLSVSFGGYATEILRSGIEAVSRGQIEAGRSLGLHRILIFRHIVLPQAIKIIYPALSSQITILLLGSSVVSAISATELTAISNSLQSQTFRSFEFYFVAAGMYLIMSALLKLFLNTFYWLYFIRGRNN